MFYNICGNLKKKKEKKVSKCWVSIYNMMKWKKVSKSVECQLQYDEIKESE